MADTAGSAGEVRVRLALDASDLQTQIRRAENEVGSGKGIELQVKLSDSVADDIAGAIPPPNKLAPVILTADIDEKTSISAINKSVKRIARLSEGGIEPITIPVKVKISKADRDLLKSLGTVKRSNAGVNAAVTATARTRKPRAMGGSYSMGDELLVGEEGPEVIRMRAPGGTVIPNRALPPTYRRHEGGKLIAGHKHSADGSTYQHPRTGQWLPTIVRSQSAAEAWRERGRYQRYDEDTGLPVGTPYKSLVVPRVGGTGSAAERAMGVRHERPLAARQLIAAEREARQYERMGDPSAAYAIRQASRGSTATEDRPKPAPKRIVSEEEAAAQASPFGVVDLGGGRKRVRASTMARRRSGIMATSPSLIGRTVLGPALEGQLGPSAQEAEELYYDPSLTTDTALRGGPSTVTRAEPEGRFQQVRRASSGTPISHGTEEQSQAGTIRRRGKTEIPEDMKGLPVHERARLLAMSPNISGDWYSRTPRKGRATVRRTRGERKYRPAHSTGLRSMSFRDPLDPGADPTSDDLERTHDAYGMSYAVNLLQATERGMDRRPRKAPAPYITREMLSRTSEGGIGRAAPEPIDFGQEPEDWELEEGEEYESYVPPGPSSPYGPAVAERRFKGVVPLRGTSGGRRAIRLRRVREETRERDARLRGEPFGYIMGRYKSTVEPPIETDERSRLVELTNEDAIAALQDADLAINTAVTEARTKNDPLYGQLRSALGSARALGEGSISREGLNPYGRSTRRQLNAIIPGFGTLLGQHRRVMRRIGRTEDPDAALEQLSKLDQLSRGMRAKWERKFGTESNPTKAWEDLSEEEKAEFREYGRAFTDSDSPGEIDREAQLLYGDDSLSLGERTKQTKMSRALRQQGNYKKDPLGTIKMNKDLVKALDAEGVDVSIDTEAAFRGARRMSLEEQLENAERKTDIDPVTGRERDMGIELNAPNLGAMLFRSTIQGLRGQRRVQAATIRAGILENELEMLDAARKDTDDEEEKEKLTEQRKQISRDLRDVRDVSLNVVKKGERSYYGGGWLGRAGGGGLRRQLALLGRVPEAPSIIGSHVRPDKPKGALWSSTYLPKSNTSDWERYAEQEMGTHHSVADKESKGYLLDPDPKSRIFHINGMRDYKELLSSFPAKADPVWGEKYNHVDWPRASKELDAVHLSKRGQWKTRYGDTNADDWSKTNDGMYGWDVESTAWLNKGFSVAGERPPKLRGGDEYDVQAELANAIKAGDKDYEAFLRKKWGLRSGGGALSRAAGGPLMQRLAQRNIQKAYDEGRFEEGQRLQQELEQAKGGWGDTGQKMEPDWIRRQRQGQGVAKEFGRWGGGNQPKGANYSGGARPSSLSDIEGVAANATQVTNVGEHGPEAIAHMPDGSQFVVPNHQMAPFRKMYGQGMQHEVMTQHPKGQPMSPWVRRAAMNQLPGKEVGRHEGGPTVGAHPHPHGNVYYNLKANRWMKTSGGFASAPRNAPGGLPGGEAGTGQFGLFGGEQTNTRGGRGHPAGPGFMFNISARRGAMDINDLSQDYSGLDDQGYQAAFPGLAAAGEQAVPLLPSRTRTSGINEFGGAGLGYGPNQAIALGAPSLGGINPRGGVGTGGYGPDFDPAMLGRDMASGFTEALDPSGTGRDIGSAASDAIGTARGDRPGPARGAEIAAARLEEARRGSSRFAGLNEDAQLRKLGLGEGDQTGYAYSDAIAGIRSKTSESLALTPVRALSVSIGQIAQTALGGRAGIQKRAAAANVQAARAQRAATFLETTREQRIAKEFELGAAEREGDDEGADALRTDIEKLKSREEYAEPLVRTETARAAKLSEGVASRRQRLTSQALGLGGIVAGTVLFSTAMSAAQAGLSKLAEAAGPAIDELGDFAMTANRAAKQISQGLIGGTGGTAEFAGQQARLGITTQTPELQRRSQLLAGSEIYKTIQDQLRSENRFSNRPQDEGVFTGFNNGGLSGIPVLGDLFGWIGQDQSLVERLGGLGDRIGPFGSSAQATDPNGETTRSRQAFLRGGGRDAQSWLDRAFYSQGFGGADYFRQAGIADDTNGSPRFNAGVTPEMLREALNNVPGSSMEFTPEDISRMLNLPENFSSVGGSEVTDVVTQTKEQKDQIKEIEGFWAEINDNSKKVNRGIGEFQVTLDDTSKRAEETAKLFDEKGLTKVAQQIRDFGIEFTGSIEDVGKALDNAALGATFQDPSKLLQSILPQATAQARAARRNTEFQQETVIPAQFATSLIKSPLQTSGGQGLFSQNPTDILGNISSAGTSSLDDWAESIQDVVDEANALKQVGIQELLNTLGVPQSAIDGVAEIADRIRDLNEYEEDLNLGIEQERYNEQLRITRRNIGDLVGLNSKNAASYRVLADVQQDGTQSYEQQVIQATKLGQMNRAQIDDQREVARLSRLQALDQRELARISLARNQRELNLQLALARLKAPGETPQERAVRRREAELIAREKQRELDIQKRTTERGFGIEDINYRVQVRGFVIQDVELKRQLDDALRQAGLGESERTIQLELRGINKFRAANEVLLQSRTAVLDSFITLGTTLEEQVMGIQATIEGQSGQFLETFEKEVRQAFKPIKQEIRETLGLIDGGQGNTSSAPGTTQRGEGVKGRKQGPIAAGGIFDAKGATRFLAGEAGSESVVVLRGVKQGMLSGGQSYGGGGGGRSVTVNIVGAVVRDDRDIEAIAAKVKKAIHDEAEVVGVG